MIRELPDDQSGLRLQLSNFVGNESLFIFWSREPLARAILEIDMCLFSFLQTNFEKFFSNLAFETFWALLAP